jgi:hypothetical protein
LLMLSLVPPLPNGDLQHSIRKNNRRSQTEYNKILDLRAQDAICQKSQRRPRCYEGQGFADAQRWQLFYCELWILSGRVGARMKSGAPESEKRDVGTLRIAVGEVVASAIADLAE